MGYSARYHLASLAAVFLALAVGILIGSEFGADVLSGATEDLEESLTEDLDDARAEIDSVEEDLATERDFSAAAFPALVDGRLRGRRIVVLGLGGLSDELREDVRAALAPTGARVGEFAILREPPDLAALARAVRPRFRNLERNPEAQSRFARQVGAALVRDRPLYGDVRRELLANFSGSPGRVDGVVVVRQTPAGLEPEEQEVVERFETGILEGAAAAGAAPLVGVERSTDEPSSVPFFVERGISTVDNLDQAAGRAALAFALRGAAGDFGVKETADSLVPSLLDPSPGGKG